MTDTITTRLNPEQQIDFFSRLAHATATRAAMFMAYGLNLSDSIEKVDYRLPGFIQYVDSPESLSSEHAEHYKADYRSWVVGNGFRDMLDGMETYLNHLQQTLISVEQQLNRVKLSDAKRRIRKFTHVGVATKLKYLDEQFSFRTDNNHYFASLTQARNCLTHRQGYVGNEDCGPDKILHLCWLGIDGTITESNGTEHAITPDTVGPIDARNFCQDDNPNLTVTIVERRLLFGMGERIEIPPRSLQEIYFLTVHTCQNLRQLSLNWMLDQGVSVNGGKRVPPPVVEQSLEMEYPDDD